MSIYNIQLASKLSNVGIHTIRIWERRYKAVNPERDPSGHRNYSKADIEKLSLLNELCKLGFTISKIANLDNDELKEKLLEHGDEKKIFKGKITEPALSEAAVEEVMIVSLMALKAYRLDIVSNELNHLKNSLNGRQFALKVALPLMGELGMAVANGDYSISHEHALSSIMKFHLSHFLYNNDSSRGPVRKKILICGVEGDMHEFGILIAAVLCKHYNYEFYYLGPNLPSEALSDAAQFLDVDSVVVGVTSMASQLGAEKIKNYLETVMAKLPEKVELIMGSSLSIPIQKKFAKKFVQLQSLDNFDQWLQEKI